MDWRCGALDWGPGGAMRLGKDEGSARPPELLLRAFHHFLILASDAALPDLVDTWPWNFYFSIYFNSFCLQVLLSGRSCNLVCEELNNERLVLTKVASLSPIESCFFCSFIWEVWCVPGSQTFLPLLKHEVWHWAHWKLGWHQTWSIWCKAEDIPASTAAPFFSVTEISFMWRSTTFTREPRLFVVQWNRYEFPGNQKNTTSLLTWQRSYDECGPRALTALLMFVCDFKRFNPF